MWNLEKAMAIITKVIKKEYGMLEEGDRVPFIFNDGVVLCSVKNGELTIDIVAGEPFRIDCNLNISASDLEEIENEQ